MDTIEVMTLRCAVVLLSAGVVPTERRSIFSERANLAGTLTMIDASGTVGRSAGDDLVSSSGTRLMDHDGAHAFEASVVLELNEVHAGSQPRAGVNGP